MALCTLGLFSFIFVSEGYPLLLIIANLIIVGLGFAFFSSPNANAVMSCVERKDYGVATSILSTMRTLGHSFSMAVVTFIISQNLGNSILADAETSLVVASMRTTFLIFTVLSTVGVFISLKRNRIAP